MRQGFTLVEVLITMAIFGLVLVFTAGVLFVKRPVEKTSEVQSEAYRGVLIGLEHVRSDLATALVDPVELDAPSLTYRMPVRDLAGLVVLSPTGEVSYGEPITVSLASGFLERQETGQPARRLCSLGSTGSVKFNRAPGLQDLVTMNLRARLPGDNGELHDYEVTASVGLANQR